VSVLVRSPDKHCEPHLTDQLGRDLVLFLDALDQCLAGRTLGLISLSGRNAGEARDNPPQWIRMTQNVDATSCSRWLHST